MQIQFKLLKATRTNFINLLEGLTVEQMNKIPTGFNNSIAWNLGHILVSQQGLCYRLAGVPSTIDKTIIQKYKIGTVPDNSATQDEIITIVNLLKTTATQMKHDYANGLFTTYTPFAPLGFEITNIDEAICYNNNHEAYHYGVATSIKKLV
jgi:hypothetical protein